MPKNKGKGGKNRRRGKNENEGVKRELVFKEDGQEYAQVCWYYKNIIICLGFDWKVFLGHQDAGQRTSGGDVLWRGKAPLPHPWETS